MKKILLTLSLVCSVFVVLSQTVVFHENFELPSQADSVTSVSTSSNSWGISTSFSFQGLRSDSCTLSQSDTVELVTDTFSTVGFSNVILEFAQICKIEFFDAAEIFTSSNGGATWTKVVGAQYLGTGNFAIAGNKFSSTSYNIWQAANNSAMPTNSWWQLEQFDLSTLLSNTANAMIKFKLTDLNNSGSAGNYGWLLDDIKVTAAVSELVPPVVNMSTPILQDSVYFLGPFDIYSNISDASGIDTAMVVFSRNNGPYDTAFMTNITGTSYMGRIDTAPAFTLGDTICYFIYATDSSLAANSTRNPASGCYQFILYNSPPPAVCSLTVSTFPLFETFDSVTTCPNSCASICPTPSGWTNVNETNGTDWHGWQGPTQGTYTGPQGDHTTGSGKYMFVESSGCYNKNAYLLTPCLDITGLSAPKLVFYYHMFDNFAQYMGELHIDVWYGGQWVNSIWSKQGDQGANWLKAEVDLTPYRSVTQIRFRAITGSSSYSDICIDDVKIWQPPAYDAGVESIDYPISPSNTGSVPVHVTVKNYGAADLNKVKVDWSVNGQMQPTVTWTGLLTPGLAIDSMLLGNYNFQSGPALIKAWTKDPNDSTDGWALNDTALKTIIACTGNLHGTFTVGGSNPDFMTLNDALFALGYCGIDSAITFLVDTGIYVEQLTLDTIPGASATNTITFRGVNGDSTQIVVQYAPSGTINNWVISMNGADYFKFENMTFEATSSGSYGRVLLIENNSDYNQFKSCIFKTNLTLSSYATPVYSSNDNDDYNVFKNCVFENGYYSVYMRGSSSTLMEKGNIFENCIATGFYYYGFYFNYQDSVIIRGNLVENRPTAPYPRGIYSYYCDGAKRIEKNNIKLSVSNYGYGMYVYYSDGTATERGVIANNFISINYTGTSSTGTNYGVYCYNSTYQDFYFNSIYLDTGSTSSRAMYCYGSSSATQYHINMMNNNFVVDFEGYALYLGYPNNVDNCDYNNIYSSVGTGMIYYNNVTYNSFASYKNASGLDIHSKSVDPGFVSSNDLHIQSSTVAAAATPIPGITDDIDGDQRNPGAPTIGADELPPIPIDAGVFKVINPDVQEAEADTIPVELVVRNFGTDTIYSMTVSYKLNNGTPVTQNYNNTLLPNESDTILYPAISIPPGHNTICGYTNLANDTNTFNDEVCKYFYGIPITDAGVTEFLDPDSGACYTSSEKVRVRIKNFGSQTIDFSQKPLTVNASVTGPNPLTLTPITISSGYLAVQATMDIFITVNYDMSQSGNYRFTAWTSINGDGDSSNDTLISKVITVFATITTFPFTEDFEAFQTGSGSYDPGTMANGWSTDPYETTYGFYQWQVGQGPTSTTLTGPAYDHTYGDPNGKYLYTESSYGTTGSRAYLITPCIDLTQFNNPSMRFFYHMHGSDCYTIRIDILKNGSWLSSTGYLLGQGQNSETDAWKQKVVDLTGNTGVVRLRFRAIKGNGGYGDMAVDDVYLYEPIQKDAGVTKIIEPDVSYSNVGSTKQVKIEVANYGLDTIKTMTVGYVAGNGIPVTEIWTGSLPPYQSAEHTFQNSYNVQPGEVDLCAFTNFANDGNTANDSTCKKFTGIPNIQVPFSDDFEGTNYFVGNSQIGKFERGLPQGNNITSAHSQSNAWMTDLDDNYTNNTNYFLITPYFDFTQATNAELSFWHYYDVESNNDAATVQYSTNGGQTWTSLGYIGDTAATNWYNSNVGGTHCFSGNSSGWVKSTYRLHQFNNSPNLVTFRFVLLTDASGNNYDGWAIDDFSISLPQIAEDAGVVKIIEPEVYVTSGTNVNVKIRIENFGSNTLTSIPVAYKVNSGTPVTATWTGSLATGNTTDYTFPTGFASPGEYTICAYTDLSNDTYTFNDEECKLISRDIGVNFIAEPGNTTVVNQPVTVKVRMENFGSDTIKTVDIAYRINTLTPVVETWTGVLAPGDAVFYTFNQTYVSLMGLYNFCAYTQLANDANAANDKLCKYVNGTVGIEKIESEGIILGQNIPNPAKDHTLIPFVLPKNGNYKFVVTDILGKQIEVYEEQGFKGDNEIRLNLSNYSKGIYFYSLKFDGSRLVKKMIVD
jgi:hypothetical protein